MSDFISPGIPVESEPYKDRTTGLMIFGFLTILLGLLAGLMIVLMLISVGLAATAPTAVPKVTIAQLVPAMGLYAGLAAALIALGIGSMRAKRWARALMLIFSWSWLGMGLLMVGFMIFLLPLITPNMRTASGGSPPLAAMNAVFVVVIVIESVIFVLIPAIWIYFYQSRHVKLTCEWRDPSSSWIDRCPLPVLGLCLWLIISAVMMLLMPLSPYRIAPFFGIFLTGFGSVVFFLVIAAIWSSSAYLIYRLDVRGWWTLLSGMLLMAISTFLTYMQHDLVEVYQLMKMPPEQIEQIKALGFFQGHSMAWSSLAFMVPMFAYLFFVKRYMRPSL